MQRISNTYDDVEYFLFAELLAANANNRAEHRTARAGGGSHTNPDAATDNHGKMLAGQTSRASWSAGTRFAQD